MAQADHEQGEADAIGEKSEQQGRRYVGQGGQMLTEQQGQAEIDAATQPLLAAIQEERPECQAAAGYGGVAWEPCRWGQGSLRPGFIVDT